MGLFKTMINWTLIFFKFFFGVFEMFGIIALGLSLFRIPYFKFIYEIILLSSIVSIVNAADYYIFNFNLVFNEVFNLIVLIILGKIILKLTFYCTTLLTVTGYISSVFIFYVFFFILESSMSVNLNDLLNSSTFPFVAQVVLCVIMSTLASILHKKRIGFVFINEKFTFKSGFRIINISLIVAIILSIIIIELTIVLLKENYNLSNLFVIIAIISIDIVFWMIYIRAKKELELYYNNRFT